MAFLCLDGPATPMQMGVICRFESDAPVDAREVARLIAERAARIPLLRRRVRFDRHPLGGAEWVDDPGFDPADHVDVNLLAVQGADDPLVEHASDWIAAPLDTRSPLWRAQVVTGLPGGGFVVLLKLHHALTDGIGAAQIGFGLLDNGVGWRAEPVAVRGPLGLRDRAELLFRQTAQSARIAAATVNAARPYPPAPTITTNSARRRIAVSRLDLADVRHIRRAYGGTTNDVTLAVLAGALRGWFRNRGQDPGPRPLRALIPVSLRGRQAAEAGGNQLSGHLCELPVHLDDPLERLRAVQAAMAQNKSAGPTRGAGALPLLAGRLPAGLHRLATPLAGRAAPLLFDIVVTNVPLPSLRLTLHDTPLTEIYPFVPLAAHHLLGVAITPYRDAVHIGLQTNGDAAPDIGALHGDLTKSLAELRELAASARTAETTPQRAGAARRR